MFALEWLINVFWTFRVRIGIVVQKIIFNWAELFVCWYFIKNLNGWDSFPGIFHLADRISVLAPTESDHVSLSLLSSATSYQAVLLKSLRMTFPKPVLECLIVPKNHLEIGKICRKFFLGNFFTVWVFSHGKPNDSEFIFWFLRRGRSAISFTALLYL